MAMVIIVENLTKYTYLYIYIKAGTNLYNKLCHCLNISVKVLAPTVKIRPLIVSMTLKYLTNNNENISKTISF